MTYNPFSLKGKTILVTGASSGIGRATAIECSKLGAKLCITGRNTYRLNETYLMLEGEGHNQFVADLTDSDNIATFAAGLPVLDGVVHSAGVIVREITPCVFLGKEQMSAIINSNLISIIELNSELFQQGKLQHSSLVHISSISAKLPHPGTGAYSASKGALCSYSHTLATELAYKKIRVNTLIPCMIKTEIIESITKGNPDYDNYKATYPMGYGKPEDVAWACIYLLSDAARWITGEEFTLSGGSQLKWR